MPEDIKGFKRLHLKLGKLPSKVANKVTRQSLRKGAKIVQAQAKSNANSFIGGNLGKTIGKALTVRSGKRSRVVIRLFVGFKKNAQETLTRTTKAGKKHFLPSVIEYGFTHVSGALVRGKGYYRKAFDTTKDITLKKVMDEMWIGIETEAKK